MLRMTCTGAQMLLYKGRHCYTVVNGSEGHQLPHTYSRATVKGMRGVLASCDSNALKTAEAAAEQSTLPYGLCVVDM